MLLRRNKKHSFMKTSLLCLLALSTLVGCVHAGGGSGGGRGSGTGGGGKPVASFFEDRKLFRRPYATFLLCSISLLIE